MQVEECLSDFVELSRAMGRDLLLSQASGGNTSVKLDGDRMLIKASGTRLMDVRPETGWLVVSSRNPDTRASIEVPMHGLIPSRWVAHVHSIPGQLLGLMPEGEARDLVKRTLAKDVPIYVVPPNAPGLDLGRAIASGFRDHPLPGGLEGTGLWILQNHGLTWGAGSSRPILQLSAELEYPLRHLFNLERFGPLRDLGAVPADDAPSSPSGKSWYRVSLAHWPARDFDWQPLFPDFAGHFEVASGGPADLVREDDASVLVLAGDHQDLRNRIDILYAHALVSTTARQHGWFRPLPGLTIRRIREMMLETGQGSGPMFKRGA
jgi:ribulose-5-phosphate 4-epimerase/fuculose-1-phosphate aldolase